MSIKPDQYERHKQRVSVRDRAKSASGRDIGAIPAVANAARRAAAEADFRVFCETYGADQFELAWSDDHLKSLRYLDTCIVEGGQFAFAMPRGSGKTTLCEWATVWALVTGRRCFVVLVGSDSGAAESRLEAIKAILTKNELLAEDFPEICFPLRELEDEPRRCKGQTVEGARTMSEWNSEQVVLPTVAGSKASGSKLVVAGITGGIRGLKHTRPDGKSIRPDLAVIDDPQTDESAKSPSQCFNREETISKAILGLSGPGRKIAAVMPCTVIRKGDMADRMLDRKEHPGWQGERMKALYSMPENMVLWEQYKNTRDESLRAGRGGKDATEFYAANREAMDKGAIVAWAARHEPDQLSGIEYCMTKYLDSPTVFAAEFQNEPLESSEYSEILSAPAICDRFNRVPRGVVPNGHDTLTAFVDVQGEALYWAVVAFAQDMTACLVDYDVYPEQDGTSYFTLRDLRKKLSLVHPRAAGFGGPISAGLDVLTKSKLMGRTFLCENGQPARVSMQLIDIGWSQSDRAVADFCRRSEWAASIKPSIGRGIGPTQAPMSEWKSDITRHGDRWCIGQTTIEKTRKVSAVMIDTNYWKSLMHKSLATPIGCAGSMTLFGEKTSTHRMIADHLTSEYPVAVTARGRTVSEWKRKPGGPDNHWFDCVVGCFVAANMLGVATPGAPSSPPARRVIVTPPKPGERVIHRAKRVA